MNFSTISKFFSSCGMTKLVILQLHFLLNCGVYQDQAQAQQLGSMQEVALEQFGLEE